MHYNHPHNSFVHAPWGRYTLYLCIPLAIAIAIGIGLALRSGHLECDVDILATTWVETPEHVVRQYTRRLSSWDYHEEYLNEDYRRVRKGNVLYINRGGKQWAVESSRGGIVDYCNISTDADSASFYGDEHYLVETVDGVRHFRHEFEKFNWDIWVDEEGRLLRWLNTGGNPPTGVDWVFSDHGIPNVIDPVVDIGWGQ